MNATLRAARNVVLCLGTAWLCGAFVYAHRTPPDAEILRSKLAWWDAHRDEYSVLFLGSSLTFRGLSPQVFDAELAAAGHDVRSFNLGVMGMSSHEADDVLRRILADKPGKLRWIVVELGYWNGDVSKGDEKTDRFIEWHSLAELRSLVDTVGRSDRPLSDKLVLLGKHALHTFYKYACVGRGGAMVRAALGTDPWSPPPEEAFVGPARGYQGLDPGTEDEDHLTRRRRFLGREAVFLGEVRATRNADRSDVDTSRYNVRAVAEQVQAVRDAGLDLVHFVPAIPEPRLELQQLADDGVVPVLIAFNDPARYPGLFRPERFFDSRHLKHDSALQFTRLFARRFAEYLETGR